MIKVMKNQTPQYLSSQNAMQDNESATIIKYFEQENKSWDEINNVLNFKYRLYSHSSVKSQLKIDFNSKCAYCESSFVHNSYGEVEHWRPKKKVTGDNSHKGYYWLGSNWDNLLWSCRVCNSTKYKGNKFPQASESQIAYRSTDNLANEVPLLLNPCDLSIDFNEVFEYDFLGNVCSSTVEGINSIEVYGLNRVDLVAERRRVAQELVRILKLIKYNEDDLLWLTEVKGYLENKLLDKCEEKIAIKKDQIDIFIEEINKRVSTEYIYAGMNRNLFKKILDRDFNTSILKEVLEETVRWD